METIQAEVTETRTIPLPRYFASRYIYPENNDKAYYQVLTKKITSFVKGEETGIATIADSIQGGWVNCSKEEYDAAVIRANAAMIKNHNETTSPPTQQQNQAFPVNVSDDKFIFGISAREYFAAKATEEPPYWFEFQSELKQPKKPKLTEILSQKTGLTEKEKRAITDWFKDPIFDLPKRLNFAQKTMEEYNKKSNEHHFKKQEERYFKWRYYFADKMLEYSTKNISK